MLSGKSNLQLYVERLRRLQHVIMHRLVHKEKRRRAAASGAADKALKKTVEARWLGPASLPGLSVWFAFGPRKQARPAPAAHCRVNRLACSRRQR